ncbi:hypothetical protein JQ612_01510 [Bradyrhizobium manausense]|uniref:hypothetical protein n=1 Tax=Bradyrhizobium manausense TaxID=989370 RepID=UPI001BA7DDF4|nr:hypothetical protein [Bradyrhizobium manausense]MBR0831852.1 hypothetical protein [Bradyrhizobium manausense]
MGNRTAKFISALVGSVIAGAPLAAVSQNAPSVPSAASTANAASECLTSPRDATPQGQHWHYRVERGTKRQCWYLRAEGGKATPSAQATDVTNAAPTAPPSVQDARAEYVGPQTSPAANAPPPAPAATAQAPGATTDGNAPQPAVATRWPDTAPAAVSPAPQSAPVSAAAAPADAQPSAQPSASPAPVALAAADSAADKPTGSVQMLLLVIGGALTLAGLLASVIYRFAGGRGRVQAADRRVNWDHQQDHDDSRAPWLNAVPPRVERPRPVDFDAVRPQARPIAAFGDAIGRIAAQGRPAEVAAVEPDETEIDYFDRELEIEATAPQLAAESHDDEDTVGHVDAHQEPVRNADAHEDDARDENAVDIDIITAMLERLAAEGPRLSQPSLELSLEADLAALARSSRGRSAARA